MHLIIEEAGPPFFTATMNGELLCRSKTPLLSAARALLKAGANPATELTMSWADGIVSMRTTVGAAASLTVTEPKEGGVRFARYSERPGELGRPIASTR